MAVLAVAGLMGVSSLAAPAAGQRTVRIERAAGAVQIDGKLDEAAWRAAEEHTGFVEYYAQTASPADPQSSVKLLYDDDAIYFGYIAMEPLMAQLKATVSDPAADVSVYSDDSIELMLCPEPNGQEYFHFLFNALGNSGDRLMCHGGSAADATWDARIDSAGTRESDRWVVEARIPFSQLPLPAHVGRVWGCQAARNRRALTGRPIISVLQPATGGFHDSSKFAALSGIEVDFRRFRCRVTDLRVREVLAPGPDGLQVKADAYVENLTASFVAFEVSGRAYRRGENGVTFGGRGALDHDEVKAFPVEFSVTQSGEYIVDMQVLQLPERRVLQTSHLFVEIAATPLALVMRQPGYRHTVYPDQQLSAVSVELRSTLPEDAWRGGALLLALVGKTNQKQVAAKAYTNLATLSGIWSLPTPELAQGDYQLCARLLAGEHALAEARLDLRVLRDAPFYYRIDQHGRLLKNGEPLLLVGIEGGFDFARLAEIGFNYTTLIGHYRKTHEELSELVRSVSQHGMLVGFNVADFAVEGGRLSQQPLTEPNRETLLRKIQLSEGLDAIAMWMLRDEPENRNMLPSLFEDCYRTLCAADALRPVGITNCSHTGLLMYADSGDIRRPDPYPGFWEDGSWFAKPTFVSDRMDQIFATPADRQIYAMPVLQTFGHNDARPNRSGPAFRDVRNMTWLAVAHGARGLSYYSWNGILGDPNLRVGVPRLVTELRELEPFILGVESVQAETGSESVHVLARRLGAEVIVCAVNTSEDAVDAELHVPALGDTQLVVISEGRTMRSAGGRIADAFGPVAVHIYSTNAQRGTALATLASVEQAVADEERRRCKPGNLAFFRASRQVNVSPNAMTRRTRAPFDGYDEGYGWMPAAVDPKDPNPVWLEVEFEHPEPVARLRAVVRDIDAYALSMLSAGTWAEVQGTTQTRPDSQRICTLYETTVVLPAPVSAQKVRFSVPRGTRPRLWCSLQELEVFPAGPSGGDDNE